MFKGHQGKHVAEEYPGTGDAGFEGTGLDGGHGAGRQLRLLNRDGSFNTDRLRERWYQRLSYHQLLTMPWGWFFALACMFFVATNAAFGTAYLLCGPRALMPSGPSAGVAPAWQAFFFSVHTFTTIGYGNLVPVGMAANLIVSVEAIYSLLASAITTGLIFARFSRVRAKLRFSQFAVIDTSRGWPSMQLRLTNASPGDLIDLTANLVFTQIEGDAAGSVRRYYPLKLERPGIAFLPLGWTLAHTIDESSPLHGMTQERLRDSRCEFLVTVAGTDASSSQAIHARTSYVAEDLRWGARHRDAYRRDVEGNLLGIDLSRFDDVTTIEDQR